VVQDVPPFSTCDGHPAKVITTNVIGLRRAQVPEESIRKLKKAFKLLFHSGLSKTTALERIAKEVEPCPEVEHLTFFAKTTERGLCR
jgi:UDP-N-acetylglucosamine acyltransferase